MSQEIYANSSEATGTEPSTSGLAESDRVSTAATFNGKSGSNVETDDASSPWNGEESYELHDEGSPAGVADPTVTVGVKLVLGRGQRCCQQIELSGRDIVKFTVLDGLYIDYNRIRGDWTEAALPSAEAWFQLEAHLWHHNTQSKEHRADISNLLKVAGSDPSGCREWEEFDRLYEVQRQLYDARRRRKNGERTRERNLGRLEEDIGCTAS
jgi:hypothetical protein